jgi:hypothetical protein
MRRFEKMDLSTPEKRHELREAYYVALKALEEKDDGLRGFNLGEYLKLPPRPPWVTWDEKNETFDVDTEMGTLEPYWIDLERCDTPEKLLEWIGHLAEKTWCTTEHIRDLIDCVEDHTTIRRARGC